MNHLSESLVPMTLDSKPFLQIMFSIHFPHFPTNIHSACAPKNYGGFFFTLFNHGDSIFISMCQIQQFPNPHIFRLKKTQHLRKLYILTDVSWFFPASHCQNDWTISTDHLVFHRQLAARSASVGFTWFHWVTYTGTSNTFKKINTAKHGKAECNTINYMKLWCISMDLFVMHLLDC